MRWPLITDLLLSCRRFPMIATQEKFETIPFFSDASADYFGIYNAGGESDFGGDPSPFNVIDDFGSAFLLGEDLDGEGAVLPVTVTWSNIDVAGATELAFSGRFSALQDEENYDLGDFIRVRGSARRARAALFLPHARISPRAIVVAMHRWRPALMAVHSPPSLSFAWTLSTVWPATRFSASSQRWAARGATAST